MKVDHFWSTFFVFRGTYRGEYAPLTAAKRIMNSE